MPSEVVRTYPILNHLLGQCIYPRSSSRPRGSELQLTRDFHLSRLCDPEEGPYRIESRKGFRSHGFEEPGADMDSGIRNGDRGRLGHCRWVRSSTRTGPRARA